MTERCHDYERYDAMMASWFDADGLSAAERADVTAHLAVCASCRESFELVSRMESALVSRPDEVPSLDGLLPAATPVSTPARVWSHPRLVAAFRGLMSPAGIAVILVMWITMFAFRFRGGIARWLESSEQVPAFSAHLTRLLVTVSRGDEYTLIGIYVVLAILLIGSTGAITMRYIRES